MITPDDIFAQSRSRANKHVRRSYSGTVDFHHNEKKIELPKAEEKVTADAPKTMFGKPNQGIMPGQNYIPPMPQQPLPNREEKANWLTPAMLNAEEGEGGTFEMKPGGSSTEEADFGWLANDLKQASDKAAELQSILEEEERVDEENQAVGSSYQSSLILDYNLGDTWQDTESAIIADPGRDMQDLGSSASSAGDTELNGNLTAEEQALFQMAMEEQESAQLSIEESGDASGAMASAFGTSDTSEESESMFGSALAPSFEDLMPARFKDMVSDMANSGSSLNETKEESDDLASSAEDSMGIRGDRPWSSRDAGESSRMSFEYGSSFDTGYRPAQASQSGYYYQDNAGTSGQLPEFGSSGSLPGTGASFSQFGGSEIGSGAVAGGDSFGIGGQGGLGGQGGFGGIGRGSADSAGGGLGSGLYGDARNDADGAKNTRITKENFSDAVGDSFSSFGD